MGFALWTTSVLNHSTKGSIFFKALNVTRSVLVNTLPAPLEMEFLETETIEQKLRGWESRQASGLLEELLQMIRKKLSSKRNRTCAQAVWKALSVTQKTS